MHLHNYCQTKHSALLHTLCRSSWTWKVNRKLQFQINLSHHCSKKLHSISPIFWQELAEIVGFPQPGTRFSPINFYIVKARNNLLRGQHNHDKSCIAVKLSRTQQKNDLLNERSVPALSSTDSRHILDYFVNTFCVMLRGERDHKPDFAFIIVCIHSLKIYTDLIEWNYAGATKAPLLRCFAFFRNRKPRKLELADTTLAVRPLVTCNWNNSSKTFFVNYILIRDTSYRKRSLVLVVITQLVLMFQKAFSLHI